MNKKEILKSFLKVAVLAFLAGIFISLGGTVYLALYNINKIVGALLFGIALFTIIFFGFHLYTGKIGNIFDNKPIYLLELLTSFIFNIGGAMLTAFLISLTRQGSTLIENAKIICEAKINDTWYSILILSFFCGWLIYLAVKAKSITDNQVIRMCFIFLAIIVFILSGFEHVIANACYFTYAGFYNWKTFGYLMLMLLGNSLGSIAFDGLLKLVEKLKNKDK
mgnify:CR=1 FL=1